MIDVDETDAIGRLPNDGSSKGELLLLLGNLVIFDDIFKPGYYNGNYLQDC